MSGDLARNLKNNMALTGESSLIANWIIIDGKYYRDLSEYADSLKKRETPKTSATMTNSNQNEPVRTKEGTKCFDGILPMKFTTVISENKYRDNKELRNIIIPEGIIEIEDYAFFRSSIESVVLPTTLIKIGKSAFGDCLNLRSVKCNNGLQEIGYATFSGCPKLTDIHLPDSIRKLDPKAFVLNTVTSTTSATNIFISGNLARKLDNYQPLTGEYSLIANWIIIDGKYCKNIAEYTRNQDKKPIEKVNPQKTQEEIIAKNERDEQTLALVEKKIQRMNEITEKMLVLKKEQEAAKGPFAYIKRKRIQKELDELTQRLKQV